MGLYCDSSTVPVRPRIPLDGDIDLTYRCNNRCRHCWISLPPDSVERNRELSTDEIVSIVDQARSMGCRHWSIGGGEPMLRDDFEEIFDYITSKSASYTLNTNGTLITQRIAHLMIRPGVKMVALYGATAEVHDHVTCNPGSFEAVIAGMHYLKEAGARFVVQIVPMADNEHQFDAMCSLAESLSDESRVGASWLRFNAYHDKVRNEEIVRQRISPHRMIEVDPPHLFGHSRTGDVALGCGCSEGEDSPFARCAGSDKFHVDPYGRLGFCSFVIDPMLRFDLRSRGFEESWNDFVPALSGGTIKWEEYTSGCKTCEMRSQCYWCPAMGYLEHGRYSAKIDYLCELARELKEHRERWAKVHIRYYSLAGLNICVESDLPITDTTFHPKFRPFEIDAPGACDVCIRHRFALPAKMNDFGEEVYSNRLFAVSRKDGAWIYRTPNEVGKSVEQVCVFNADYTRGTIYSASPELYLAGNVHALSLMVSDQVLFSQTLTHYNACYFHGAAASINDAGFMFLGHSGAGKSTIAEMIEGRFDLIGDEHVIVREWPDGLWIHQTWSHNAIRMRGISKAPLKAVFFLEQAKENRAERVDTLVATERLILRMMSPLQTRDWWSKNLLLLDQITRNVPCYILHFDMSGEILNVLGQIAEEMRGRDVAVHG